MSSGIIRACTLVTYELDHMNRVYSPEGIAPTIHTCGGGNTEPKIYIPDGEPENPDSATRAAEINAPDWWKMHRIVWSAGGLSPCITTRADHSPRVVIEVGE